MESLVAKILRKYPAGRKDALITLLQELQLETGYLTEDSLREISRYMNIPLNKIYGVAAFYDQFRCEKKGKYHIQVCNGTACYIYRSGRLLEALEEILRIKSGETSPDGKFSIEVVNCLGACASSPVIVINGKAYGDVVPEKLRMILSGIVDSNE